MRLSASTWVSQRRRSGEVPHPRPDSKTGQVAMRQERQKVCQWRQNLPGLPRAQPGRAKTSQRGRIRDCQDYRTCFGQNSLQEIGLEIFSGCGRLSRAMRKRLKAVQCIEIDNIHGPQFDLTSRKVQRDIFKLLQSGQIVYVWLRTPCNSWSRSRRGPGSLRDDHDNIYGFPWLKKADMQQIHVGNSLMRFSARVFRYCLAHGIPVTLETPHTSRLWLAPPIRYLVSHKNTEYVTTDFCQDNMPWRQRTGFLSANISLRSKCRRCTGPRGVCSRTRVSHERPADARGGKLRTLLAHPWLLCSRLASAFAYTIHHTKSQALWKYFV